MLLPEQRDIKAIESRIAALNAELQQTEQNCRREQQRLDSEIGKRQRRLDQQAAEYDRIQSLIAQMNSQIGGLQEEISMLDYGLYRPTFVFANSDHYKDALKRVRQDQKDMIKLGQACTGSNSWTVNGSVSEGKKMVADMQKLLLRAFNSECDDIVANVRVSNRDKSLQRIQSIRDSISKLGRIMQISITQGYTNLKIKELNLALDFAQKKEEEKERLRELRAQEREEAKAQKEIEEARKRLAKEQAHYQNALRTLQTQLAADPGNPDLLAKRAELEAGIAETERAIADVDYREANKRAGYVYIISNIGAFGDNVYKIGMTRRLDPMDRVNELGDASVPFSFDVHALIFTEDAPGLEAALHQAFDSRKVNKINHRREFFRVSLDEIKTVVRSNFDKTVEWVDVPEAEQYRQSVAAGAPPRTAEPPRLQPMPSPTIPQPAQTTAPQAPAPALQTLPSIIETISQNLDSIAAGGSLKQEDTPDFVRLHIYTAAGQKRAVLKIMKSDLSMQLRKFTNGIPAAFDVKDPDACLQILRVE
ncbi:MAG: DUF4041 domain-containing protein [Oscillospiraceae bacterium]|nr:DUF4041 domain-containing protein [Oscillospiraceae bacterium]